MSFLSDSFTIQRNYYDVINNIQDFNKNFSNEKIIKNKKLFDLLSNYSDFIFLFEQNEDYLNENRELLFLDNTVFSHKLLLLNAYTKFHINENNGLVVFYHGNDIEDKYFDHINYLDSSYPEDTYLRGYDLLSKLNYLKNEKTSDSGLIIKEIALFNKLITKEEIDTLNLINQSSYKDRFFSHFNLTFHSKKNDKIIPFLSF